MMSYLVQNRIWFGVIAFVVLVVAGCKPVEVPNEVTSCGMKKVDCAQIEGWESGTCNQGVCVPNACKYTYLLKTESSGLLSHDVVRCDPVGAIIKFGKYEQDGDDANGKEDIEWRVLDRDCSKVLLISDKTLDVKRYNETKRNITWEKSTIRSWLNGYDSSFNENGIDYSHDSFLKSAFSEEEQAKIVNTNVPVHVNLLHSTSPVHAMADKIFLLSVNEAKNYFSSNNDRRAAATEYALLKGVLRYSSVSFQYSTYWWLRSPGDDDNSVAYVDFTATSAAMDSALTTVASPFVPLCG